MVEKIMVEKIEEYVENKRLFLGGINV